MSKVKPRTALAEVDERAKGAQEAVLSLLIALIEHGIVPQSVAKAVVEATTISFDGSLGAAGEALDDLLGEPYFREREARQAAELREVKDLLR